jgi:ketosteroid isomerase-like protein
MQTAISSVADDLVSLCRSGRNMEAIETLYSPDIVSIESMGNETMPREVRGLDAVRGKGEWWRANNEVHSATVDGPFVGGDDKFAVYYNYDTTFKPTGQRNNMEEMALYTVKDGKVVQEQFFYRTSGA